MERNITKRKTSSLLLLSSLILFLFLAFYLNSFASLNIALAQPSINSDVDCPCNKTTNSSSYTTSESWNYSLGALPEPFESGELGVVTTGETLPSSFDWRNVDGTDWMTPVKDQGGCGSCVAFASIGTTEAQFNIVAGDPTWDLDLSEQHLFSCGGGSCHYGWYVSAALDYIQNYGVPDEACYFYIAKDSGTGAPCAGTCPGWTSRAYKIKSWEWLSGRTAIKTALLEGPVVATFTVYEDFWFLGNEEVYHHKWGTAVGGHAIVIVGYNEIYDYWIVKNSWGSDWNGDGYFYIGFGEAGIDDWIARMTAGISTITFTTSGLGSGTSGTIITIDGTGYTYSQLPESFTWKVGSTHSVSASTTISVGGGKKYTWTSWTNGDGLSGSSGTYVVPAFSMTTTANYNTEYFLTVNSDYDTSGGEGWHIKNTNAYATLDTGEVPVGTGSRRFFTGWSGDASGTGLTSNPIFMSGPKTATANWETQHQFSVTSTGLSGTTSFTFKYGTSSPPINLQDVTGGATWMSGWYTAGTQIFFEIDPDSEYLNDPSVDGKRYDFSSWSHSSPITLNSYVTLTASYDTQYRLIVESDHDSPSPFGTNWYNSETDVSCSITSPADDDGSGTRYRCISYTLDSGTPVSTPPFTINVEMSAPHHLRWNWTPQYYLDTITYPLGLDAPTGEGWYDSGTSASFGTSTITDYTFQYWYLDGQQGTPHSTSLSSSLTMDSPHTATAYYKMTTTISSSSIPSSITLGNSTTISGSIVPPQSNVPVTLSFSTDGESTWNPFITVNTDMTGNYSINWIPPYPLIYSVRSSWNGNTDYAGATSDSSSLTVTGSVPPQPSLFITVPSSSYDKGDSVPVTVTVYNPTDSTLQSTLYISITGASGYYYVDFTSITIEIDAYATTVFNWLVPTNIQAGTYQLSANLIPSLLTAYDMEYVEIK